MVVELGAPVVLATVAPALWHVPCAEKTDGRCRPLVDDQGYPATTTWPALCGLDGDVYAYGGPIRKRRVCAICRQRAPGRLVAPDSEAEETETRRGRPKGSGRKVTAAQLAVLHRVYVEEKLSVRAVAERVWERLGYKTPNACATALDRAFRADGYPMRSVSEALVLRNTRHGRKARAIDGTEAEYEYRRWLKRQRGAYRPRCQGVRARPPRKGARCQKPARSGSDYCYAHDPARAADRDAHLATMRSLSPLAQRPLAEWETVRQELLAAYRLLGSWEPIATAMGLSEQSVRTYASDRQRRVSVEKAAQFQAAVATATARERAAA